MQYVVDVPPEGLGTLLRGLLAQLEPEVDRVYGEAVPEMRSRFYPVMRELVARGSSTIGELAEAARVSQPAMTQTVRQMVDAGLLVSGPGADRRSRRVELSRRGREAVVDLRPVWNDVASAAESLDRDVSVRLTTVLNRCLKALERKSFAVRIAEARERR